MSLIKIKTTGLKTFWDVIAEKININILKDRLPKNEAWSTVGSTGKPVFQNGWENATGDNSDWNSGLVNDGYRLQYRKDATGRVFIRGQIQNGTTNAIIFVLPVGYRPNKDVVFTVSCNISEGFEYHPQIIVKSNGEVRYESYVPYEPVDLSSINFFID